jgi:hypothetical protein
MQEKSMKILQGRDHSGGLGTDCMTIWYIIVKKYSCSATCHGGSCSSRKYRSYSNLTSSVRGEVECSALRLGRASSLEK